MSIAPKYTPQNPGPTPGFPSFHEAAPRNAVHTGYYCHACLCSPIVGARHRCDTCCVDFCDGCHAKHAAEYHHNLNETLGPTLMRSCVQAEMRKISIMVDIIMPSPIISIQCPSHTSEAKISKSDSPSYHAVVVFESTSTSSLSKDFILLIEQQQCFDPRALCELDMTNGIAAISLAFVPPPIDMLSASQIKCELIFLIDCSGSMEGPSIACVRDCMQILLRSLPVNSRFNIIKFGSRWSSLFPDSQQYNDASLWQASRHISMLKADLGGTEIYPPLHHALSSKGEETHPRQVFLFTDGQVTNVKQLALLVSEHTARTRLFTFGIGKDVDRLLCKKLAQAGHGKCEFVTVEDKGGSLMREKVVRQIARAMQPVLNDVTVDWGILRQTINPVEADDVLPHSGMPRTVAPHDSFMQCPSVAPAIFMSSRYMLHALNVFLPDQVWQQAKEGKEVDFQCEIGFTACSNHPLEKERMQYSVTLTGRQITLAGVIHTLAAKERIRELEDKFLSCRPAFKERKKIEEEILQLAMKYTLTSTKTSFVVTYMDTGSEGTEEVALSPDAHRDFVAPHLLSQTLFGGVNKQDGFTSASPFTVGNLSTAKPFQRMNSASVPMFGSSVPQSPMVIQPQLLLGSVDKQRGLTSASLFTVGNLSTAKPFPSMNSASVTMFGSSVPQCGSVDKQHDFTSASPTTGVCQSRTKPFPSVEAFPKKDVQISLSATMYSPSVPQPLFGSVDEQHGFTSASPFTFVSQLAAMPFPSVGDFPKKDVPMYNSSVPMYSPSSPMYSPVYPGSSIPVDLPVNPQSDDLSEAFTDLISLQSANGSWQLTPELINISVSIISRASSYVPRALTIESLHAISKEYAIDDVSIAVIVSLEILKKYFQQRQVEWEMLAAKAAFFLKNTCNINANIQQKVVESVAKLLGT
ncbi:hypothetical protein KP509_10G069600 [Ceratopteris richardii]|nr:hypothetical protein KP509_10G069600 [Ceratopteris richardii]